VVDSITVVCRWWLGSITAVCRWWLGSWGGKQQTRMIMINVLLGCYICQVLAVPHAYRTSALSLPD